MSSAQTSQMFRTEGERRSRDNVENHRRETNRLAHAADEIAQNNSQRRNRFQEFLREHDDHSRAGFAASVGYFLPLAVLPAAFTFDFLLSGGTAKYIVGINFADVPMMIWVARFAVPIALLAVELFVAYMITSARNAGSRTSQLLSVLMGAVLVVAIGAFTIVAHPSMVDETGVIESADWKMRTFGLAVIVAFSLVIHSAIVFGGPLIHRAFTHSGFLMKRQRDLRIIRREDAEETQLANDAASEFSDYLTARQRHIQEYGPIVVGEFDATTSRVINAVSGYERIRLAHDAANDGQPRSGNGASPPPAREPAPVPPPAAAASGNGTSHSHGGYSSTQSYDGETVGAEDYLRGILDRRRKDQDGEVGGED